MANSENNQRYFLGIPVEGNQYREQPTVEQRPIEDLAPYFEALWNKGVKAVSWTQYTPYFNDGDICEFIVNEPSFTTSSEVAAAWLDGSDEIEEESGDWLDVSPYNYERPWSDKYPHPDGLAKEDMDLPVHHYRFEYAMREAFGDHTRVVVTPEKVVQWEYSHD